MTLIHFLPYTHLITLPNQLFAANDVLQWHFDIVKVERARRTRSNAKLLLLLGDFNTHLLFYDETGNALVTFRWVDRGEDQEL